MNAVQHVHTQTFYAVNFLLANTIMYMINSISFLNVYDKYKYIFQSFGYK